jgi:O-antigen/teichoic acid export membrane protein
MITFPAMIYLTFGLKYPVAAFLSPHWQEVLPLIAILAPAGAAQSIAAYAGPILLAHDKARLQFWVSTANSASMILAFVVALPFGLTAVAVVYLVVSILVCAFMLMVGARNCAVSYASLFGALMPATVATSLGAVCALVATRGDVASLSHWLIATAVYTLIVLGSYVVFRRRIWSSVQSLLGGSAPVQANLPSAS